MNLALNNTMNVYEHYKELGEEVAVEIVAYSQGLHMLREDTSPVKDRIKAMRALGEEHSPSPPATTPSAAWKRPKARRLR